MPPDLHAADTVQDRFHVFVSYSRKDQTFVRALHGGLARAGRDAWVDWEDVPPSADWWKEVERAIEAADVVVFVISPDSVASRTCALECEYAAKWNKRIIPILLHEVPATAIPDVVARINWLRLDGAAIDQDVATLLKVVETDLDWLRAHSRLLVRAREWDSNGKDSGYLLGGADLDQAERWLMNSEALDPKLSPLQISFVAASRQEATRRQKNQLRGFYIVSLVYSGLQIVTSYFVAFDELSETALMYLSPLWVTGMVFGLFGLTLGKTSLKRSIVAAVFSGVALYLFFITLWPAL